MASPFGPVLDPAPGPSPAAWIAPALAPTHGSVGAVIPTGFDSYLQVALDDEPASNLETFGAIADLGVRFTATPEHAWFAIWEGWGFATARTLSAYWSGVTAVDRLRGRWSAWNRRRTAQPEAAAVAATLRQLPRFDLPIRTYYLLQGRVLAATAVVEPGQLPRPHLPDLWWPNDRTWFVAGDTDLSWIYVAGTNDLTTALKAELGSRCMRVEPEHRIAPPE